MDWRLSAVGAQIDDVHASRRHRYRRTSRSRLLGAATTTAVARRLDGAEICHPMIYIERANSSRSSTVSAACRWPRSDRRTFTASAGSACAEPTCSRGTTAPAPFSRRFARGGPSSTGDTADGVRRPGPHRAGRDASGLREQATRDARPSWLDWIGVAAGLAGLAGLVVTRPIAYAAASPEAHS